MQNRKCSSTRQEQSLAKTQKVYVGLTENKIKKHSAVHKTTFKIDLNKKNHLKYKKSTKISKEIHKIKEKNKEYETLQIIIKQI